MKANVSSKYVTIIQTLKLLAMHIFHITPRILPRNIQYCVQYNFYRKFSNVQKLHFQLAKIQINTS